MGFYHYRWVMMILVALELCFFYASSQSQQQLTCHPRDLAALRDFIHVLKPKPHGWVFNSSADCCQWVGITCNSSSSLRLNDPDNNTARVTKLELAYRQLSGTLSESLGFLDQIRVLDLSTNSISGSIPPSVFNLVNLETLDLSYNGLTGQIPEILNLPSLINLDLSSNSLTGPCRLNCAVMTNLTTLHLGSNSFSSSLPENLPYCRNLKCVNLARNRFEGKVPESYKDFHSLSVLSLSHCSLVNISSTLRILEHCKNLTALFLTSSYRGETFPEDPSLHFVKLKVLTVANCGLTGPMPSWLSKSTNLQVLDLSCNYLTGAIPDYTGGFTSLYYLGLSRNSFTGVIPKSLSMLQSLPSRDEDSSFDVAFVVFPFLFRMIDTSGFIPTIDLSYNNLYGPIWEEFGNLKQLNVFDLSANRLSGAIPRTLSRMTSLEVLDLSYNNLYGPIWEEFGNLKQLNVFDLSANRLSGAIPRTLSRMTSLEVLDLSNNNISGSIPGSLQLLTSLSKFSVANNSLSGRIPSGGRFIHFSRLDFEGNHFCGGDSFPQCDLDTPQEPEQAEQSRTSDSDSDLVLDFSYGLALGYGLALVIAAYLTCSAFELPAK
ncbi:unnamed protein product [Microthlaspi erraticum]|uniref:Leucine-rich repeat-containing N-terminal plant-type domain-containing protein n=1 Tax=Microthlaspi erraticum TaxID=1685480 RepID=A0A6D2J606_9BRAS|nr:unnamed protein product [Microthlaspi erraticum]